MRLRSLCVASLLAAMVLTGCARPPSETLGLSAFAPAEHAGSAADVVAATVLAPVAAAPVAPRSIFPFFRRDDGLAGRTLVADSIADLVLNPGEVILTFDDGPRPGRTDAILATLGRFNAHATFLMVGEAAQAHPELVQAVARAGHTVGTHTHSHANLSLLPPSAAMSQVWRGYHAVADALAPIHQEPSRFFRFPYLAQSMLLRANMAEGNLIVLDVQVDSNDWFRETAQQVLNRTLARLDAQGKGIILFHDIHQRTVDMLPALLQALDDRGYTVVTLRSRGTSVFDTEIIAATD